MAVWLATWELEEPEMKMLVKAFVEAFPYTSLWDCLHPFEWLLIGSKHPIEIDLASLEKRMSKQPIAGDLRKIGIDSPAALLGLYMKGQKFLLEFAGNSDPVTDDKSVVDFTSPRYARASFGLGETITGGLRVRSTGFGKGHGDVRDFDRVYTSRESVDPFIVNYGPYDPAAFRQKLKRWRTAYEVRVSQSYLVPEVMATAQAYAKEGEHQKALDAMDHGLSLVSESASQPILQFSGWLYHSLGQYEKARSNLQEALRLKPGDATTHLLLGNTLATQGNHREAIKHFQKALEIDPKLEPARQALAKYGSIVPQNGKETAGPRSGELP
jgi:tetratricopeptide (TPR) repeat protein